MANHLEDHNAVPVHGRRAFLKRSAVAGLTVAYAVPLIETLRVTDVSAATSPAPGTGVCTRTIGYYKNHADTVSGLLPITLGNGGGATVTVTSTSQVAAIEGTTSNGKCKLDQLYAQLLAAKLNVARGATSGTCTIGVTISAADTLISSVTYCNLTAAQEATAVSLATTLDTYNNGNLAGCPAHCPS